MPCIAFSLAYAISLSQEVKISSKRKCGRCGDKCKKSNRKVLLQILN